MLVFAVYRAVWTALVILPLSWYNSETERVWSAFMKEPLLYRSAAKEDCRAVYEMICDMEARELPYLAFEAIFRELLADGSHEFLVFELDGNVIAVIHLRYENQLHHAARIAEIMEFVVRSDCRNRGYGQDLFRLAVEAAETRGCLQIEVACNQLRKDTHRFYMREGMKNYHFKLSKGLSGLVFDGNVLGR